MSTDPGTMEIVETDLVPFEEIDDPNHKAHYVRPADNGHTQADDPTTAQDLVDMARLTGTPVITLCGLRWVPKANPKNHSICTQCIDIAEAIWRGDRP